MCPSWCGGGGGGLPAVQLASLLEACSSAVLLTKQPNGVLKPCFRQNYSLQPCYLHTHYSHEVGEFLRVKEVRLKAYKSCS